MRPGTRQRLLAGMFAIAAGAGGALMLGSAGARTTAAPPGAAVYLSAGDGIQWGCCGDPAQSADALFARYLSDRLGRQVEWVTLAKDDGPSPVTTDTFLNRPGGRPSQMQRLVEALAEYRRQQRPVVAITLSVGGNNLVAVGNACHSPPCTALYRQALARMTPQLDAIYQGINAAKDPGTPLLVLTYYNASNCGQAGVEASPTELGVRGWNAAIQAAVTRNGAFLVDGYTPFKGRACDLVNGLDLAYAGHQVMAEQYKQAYAALPAAYVDPFRKSETSPLVIAAFLAGGLVSLGALTWVRSRLQSGTRAET